MAPLLSVPDLLPSLGFLCKDCSLAPWTRSFLLSFSFFSPAFSNLLPSLGSDTIKPHLIFYCNTAWPQYNLTMSFNDQKMTDSISKFS